MFFPKGRGDKEGHIDYYSTSHWQPVPKIRKRRVYKLEIKK